MKNKGLSQYGFRNHTAVDKGISALQCSVGSWRAGRQRKPPLGEVPPAGGGGGLGSTETASPKSIRALSNLSLRTVSQDGVAIQT